MVKSMLNAVNRMCAHEDAGRFLLRLVVGGLMLFHGLHKLIDGVDGISGMLVASGARINHSGDLHPPGGAGAGLYDDCRLDDGGGEYHRAAG